MNGDFPETERIYEIKTPGCVFVSAAYKKDSLSEQGKTLTLPKYLATQKQDYKVAHIASFRNHSTAESKNYQWIQNTEYN